MSSCLKSNETLNEVIGLDLGANPFEGGSAAFEEGNAPSPFEGIGDHLSIERVTPLEEFNTLYRNKDMVRASIKLKESNLI